MFWQFIWLQTLSFYWKKLLHCSSQIKVYLLELELYELQARSPSECRFLDSIESGEKAVHESNFLIKSLFPNSKIWASKTHFFSQSDNGLLGKKRMMKWNDKTKTETMQSVLKQFKNMHLPVNREHSFAIEI